MFTFVTPIYAESIEQTATSISSTIAHGKIFKNGVNESIEYENQFDTFITNVELENVNTYYLLRFDFESNNIQIPVVMVEAKMNNVNSDHFCLAPINYSNDLFEIVNISFTTNANKHDLLPVNYESMSTKPVITIIVKRGNDVYYWQTILSSNDISTKTNNNYDLNSYFSIKTYNSSELITAANEYYFLKGNESAQFEISSEELELQTSEISTIENLEINETKSSSNNPYYDYGVPNSAFQTVKEAWNWRYIGGNSMGLDETLRYYWSTYQKNGSNNLYTSIVFIEVIMDKPLTYTPHNINGTVYNVAEAKIIATIKLTPHTVIYYPSQDLYELMVGGENLIKIDNPTLQVKKYSDGVEHFIYGRYNYSYATKTSSTTALVNTLSSIAVKLLDKITNEIASRIWELRELVGSANYSINSNSGGNCEHDITNKIGDMSVTLNGCMHRAGHNFGMICELAAPASAGDAVLGCILIALLDISYK